jgi:hypothetical protein
MPLGFFSLCIPAPRRGAYMKTHGVARRVISLGESLIFCALSVVLLPNYVNHRPVELPAEVAMDSVSVEALPAVPMNIALWSYLRRGLNYVEASGRDYPADFVHPGGCAFGPLALTRIAVEDVRDDLYECFAQYYADLLLDHYLGLPYQSMAEEKVFGILQQAWFLGPGLYKQGKTVIASRMVHAQEYVENPRVSSSL